MVTFRSTAVHSATTGGYSCTLPWKPLEKNGNQTWLNIFHIRITKSSTIRCAFWFCIELFWTRKWLLWRIVRLNRHIVISLSLNVFGWDQFAVYKILHNTCIRRESALSYYDCMIMTHKLEGVTYEGHSVNKTPLFFCFLNVYRLKLSHLDLWDGLLDFRVLNLQWLME